MSKTRFKPKVVRVFTSFHLTEAERHTITSAFLIEDDSSTLVFNKSGRCDLAVVVNFDRAFSYVYGPNLHIVKWLMEPRVKQKINWNFTHIHSRIFSRIYSHAATIDDEREVNSPPLVPPHVPQVPIEELLSAKTKLISAIGSNQNALPGHRARTEILDAIEANAHFGVDVFGKGRAYIKEKREGLHSYRYSIAIENSTTPNYWTEKLSDCFLSLTVPIYLGAPNATEYFPAESMITVSWEDLSSRLDVLLSRISVEDFERRIPFLLEARRLIIEKYDFGRQIASLLRETQGKSGRQKSFSRVWTLDTFIFKLYELGAMSKRFIRKLSRGEGITR